MEKQTKTVAIGNGLYVKIRAGETLLEWYRRLQANCPHEHRDPRGQCYNCGKREVGVEA